MSASYGQSLAQSLTIEEMRTIHRHALTEAEAKKTELKLVLASRYRELVGSSDEVLDMQRDAQVLQEWVLKLPTLMDEWIAVARNPPSVHVLSANENENDNQTMLHGVQDSRYKDKCFLAAAPRIIHGCLDELDVLGAAVTLIQTFQCITKYTSHYPLANAFRHHRFVHYPHSISIHPNSIERNDDSLHQYDPDAELLIQIQMIYLHLQTLPVGAIQKAKYILLRPSSKQEDCIAAARALAAIHMFQIPNLEETATHDYESKAHHTSWMDVYFECKAKLMQGLLEDLSYQQEDGGKVDPIIKPNASLSVKQKPHSSSQEVSDSSEQVISQILTMLQYDIILFPYQIFHLRKIPAQNKFQNNDMNMILSSMSKVDEVQLKSKVSSFLATYLPIIRSKVKTILVAMAGTTASRLGHFRQSLYDKTDGADFLATLSTDVCSWDDAIQLIDTKSIARALDGTSNTTAFASMVSTVSYSLPQRKFSLWNTLFSGIFSSLVNSILTTSFHSVHRQVISAVRSSLANAPAFKDILPHEAYRNTLRIATEMDNSLKKVSDDAHELLVHAEEKEESVLRLKQSLYVQTCQIMGRLLSELRRMLSGSSQDENGTKELIVGRLCYLLKFRLSSLSTLLDPDSSPAAIAVKTGVRVGMISIADLKSAFDVADIDNDGIVTLEESIETLESAFSGTQFHGADIVKDTMLVSSEGKSDGLSYMNPTFTALELVLLSAQGLRHEMHGPDSAIGTVERLLDDLIKISFSDWAEVLLSPISKKHKYALDEFFRISTTVSEEEWKRLYLSVSTSDGYSLTLGTGDISTPKGSSKTFLSTIGSICSFHLNYLISIAIDLNRSFCPTDTISPLPDSGSDASLIRILRTYVMEYSIMFLIDNFTNCESKLENCTPVSLVHLYIDFQFIYQFYFKRNDLVSNATSLSSVDVFVKGEKVLSELCQKVRSVLVKSEIEIGDFQALMQVRHENVFLSCSMFFSDLLGDNQSKMLKDLEALAASDSIPLITNPLPSSCRFTLLPIQTGQSVQELELLYNLENERSGKTEINSKGSSASAAASAVSSSFGYISSLLKKK